MTYIPLARKWRPKTFSQLKGQEHVVTPIQNALLQLKLHHAYLFTGTRGVGKTTVARIFAKALNCQSGIVNEPCLVCDHCIAIDEGRFFDLIEVDGASRTRVEDTRELIENIQYTPTTGRFKIFLIDEVHMLSIHSFNALLKTLEEPPAHVKFLLATTELQKIPATILSRCLQFNLSPITYTTIVSQLSDILIAEGYKFDNASLERIAQAAKGSMRDALTLCEQLLAAFPNGLISQEIETFLGTHQDAFAEQLLSALIQNQALRVIEICDQLTSQQASFIKLIQTLMQLLHQCAIAKVLPNHSFPNQEQAILTECTKHWSALNIDTVYQLLEKTTQELDWAPNPAIGFQMLMLRILYTLYGSKTIHMQSVKEAALPATAPVIEKESVPALQTYSEFNWSEIVAKLELDGIGKSALNHSELVEILEDSLILKVGKHSVSLFSATIKARIEKALSTYFNTHKKLIIQTQLDTEAIHTPAQHIESQKKQIHEEQRQMINKDPFVQKLLKDYQAEIIIDTP